MPSKRDTSYLKQKEMPTIRKRPSSTGGAAAESTSRAAGEEEGTTTAEPTNTVVVTVVRPKSYHRGETTASSSSGTTSDAMADSFCTSLAEIAAANAKQNDEKKKKGSAASCRSDGSSVADAAESVNNGSDGGGGAHSSSSGSSSRDRSDASGGGGAAVVTGSNTTSSGSGDTGSGEASKGSSSSDSGQDGGRPSNHQRLTDKRQRHSHRQQEHERQQEQQQQQQRQKQQSESASASDGYGLPVPRDDRLQHQRSASEHAAVVAHLPPPKPDSSYSSGSGAESEKAGGCDEASRSLLQPHREPGFHTIRRTFKRLVSRRDAGAGTRNSETDSSGERHQLKPSHHKHKRPSLGSDHTGPKAKKTKKSHPSNSSSSSDADDSGGNGSSSGSGTEGGYAGSASSNENAPRAGSCSSPSESSSEESVGKRMKHAKRNAAAGGIRDPAGSRPMISKKQDSSLSVSSEIADFSSGSSSECGTFAAAFRASPSRSPSMSSDEQDDDGDAYMRDSSVAAAARREVLKQASVSRKRRGAWPDFSVVRGKSSSMDKKPPARQARLKADQSMKPAPKLEGKPPIMAVGCDVMAHILTFLEPPEILDVLTMPLSNDWTRSFTKQGELWRVLCLLEPFKAPVESGSDDDSDDDSMDSFSLGNGGEVSGSFGKYRLLYTKFIRCMRYLSRIKEDAANGRQPSVIDYGTPQTARQNISSNRNLQQFLASARGFVIGSREGSVENSDISDDDNAAADPPAGAAAAAARAVNRDPIGVSDDGSSTCDVGALASKSNPSKSSGKKKKVRYAASSITSRLLGPASDGRPGQVELPWSCAIYSIVNWMVAFGDVEGIQTMCLKVLPFLLENEQQRITAQRAGLTDAVLCAMVMFPESAALHTAAFHTIVLLARPLGGHEGMLFHSSMLTSSGIFNAQEGSRGGRTGIAVMIDSMRRFESDETLQAMSCWALVNIALAPPQKEMLVKLGGIQVTANAMMAHPYSAEVQFRALFALINLVIPSVSVNANNDGGEENPEAIQPVPAQESSEKEMMDEMVDQVVNLVVLAMKNFCASEAILNRACLVLHNLSLAPEYHSALLWAPNCYQLLEWTMANYPQDQVLQQSAAGTLHRLQITLSGDEGLRARFTASLQAQQQLSLEQAHHEAVILHEQQRQAQQQRQPAVAGPLEEAEILL